MDQKPTAKRRRTAPREPHQHPQQPEVAALVQKLVEDSSYTIPPGLFWIMNPDGSTESLHDPVAWGQWMYDHQEFRIIGQQVLPTGAEISTVFLGLNHDFTWYTHTAPPILFETMLFTPGSKAGPALLQRYHTRDEAKMGHESWVKLGAGAVPHPGAGHDFVMITTPHFQREQPIGSNALPTARPGRMTMCPTCKGEGVFQTGEFPGDERNCDTCGCEGEIPAAGAKE